MSQFKAFIRSAEKSTRVQQAMAIQAAGFAMADGKATKKVLDKLLD